MFKNERYITKGIKEEVSIGVQLLIWRMIDKLNHVQGELDYLQVFELKRDDKQQIIKHKQEVPSYINEIKLEMDQPIEVKIFVIDDGMNSKCF